MAGRDVRIEDTTCFRTFALQWRIHGIGMGSRFGLMIGLCGGTISIPFGGVRLVFLVGGWWRLKWWCRWVPPLWKLGQPIPIALQCLVPLATTKQIVSLLLELLSLPEACLYQKHMNVNDRYTLVAAVPVHDVVTCTSLLGLKFPSPSVVGVSCIDVGPDSVLSTLFGAVGGSCDGWDMVTSAPSPLTSR